MNEKEFSLKLKKWTIDYPELDFLGDELLEYQQALKNKEINKEEYDCLIESLLDLENITEKLKKAIEIDKIQEAIDFLRDLAKLGAIAIAI